MLPEWTAFRGGDHGTAGPKNPSGWLRVEATQEKLELQYRNVYSTKKDKVEDKFIWRRGSKPEGAR
jgi:hypothetical protein